MSIFQRIATIFGAKANKALDKAENPNETLDYSYQKQLELLQKVRRGVADVATSRSASSCRSTSSNSSRTSCPVRPRRPCRSAVRTSPARL